MNKNMLMVIFYFNKVGVLILWVFVMTYIYFYQIDTTFNLTVKMGHSVWEIQKCKNGQMLCKSKLF